MDTAAARETADYASGSGKRALRMGITVGLREHGESLWINGIKQNALYLAKLFQHSPRAHDVVLVNTTFINQEYDEVWAIPQVMETSAAFFGTLRRKPVREVPFIWDPMCLDQHTRDLPDGGWYRPRRNASGKRISVMEPNVDVLKFCLYPTLIAEEAYRQKPGVVEYVHVCNSQNLAQHSPEFIGVVQHLDLVRAIIK